MKKIIYIIIIITIVIGMLYWNKNQNQYEDVELDINTTIKEEKINTTIKIHIAGAIKNPGIIELEENARIADAVEKAGGMTEEANIEKINLAYQVKDGQKIYIPSIYDIEETEIITNEAGEKIIENEENSSESLININTATETELETLPGIGPSTALKIVKYRKENGNFKKIEEIKNVSGIGESKYEKIKEYICTN